MEMTTPITIERTFATTPELLWALWTTKEGIESWWGPEGFTVEVLEHDLRPGGRLHYAMTASATETVAFMKQAGLPLTNHAHATFGELAPFRSFTYASLIDFVPGVAPYTIQNRIDLVPGDEAVGPRAPWGARRRSRSGTWRSSSDCRRDSGRS